MEKKIAAGIIGYGLAGRVFHAPLLASIDEFQVRKISTRDPEKTAAIQSRYPDTKVVTDYQQIINDPSIELVIIASPNEFHFTQAKEALENGKNLVVDKPFTITSKEASELIAISKEKKLLLSAFQNRRWDGDFLTLKKIIDSGRLGDIAEAEMHYDRFRNYIKPDTWKEEDGPGSGIIFDLGSHIIDQALILFGIPESLTAFLIKQRKGAKAEDNFEIIFHYPQLKLSLKAGMLVSARIPRYMLLGDKGSFVKYGLDPQESQLNAGMKPGENGFGIEPKTEWGNLRTYIDADNFEEQIIETEPGNYRRYYENISDALRGKAELQVKAEQALNTVRIIELALQSNRERRTVNFSEL